MRHYLGIARDGYTNVGDARLRLVFFPLYPAVTRVFSAFTGGNLFAAGILVSLLCSGLCAALLYDLAAMHLDGRGARLAVAYFLLSPMSVFLACAYTEALFISLTLETVCLLRRGHPWGAALCGMASALTRMPGVIVSGLFIIAFLARIPREGLRMKAVLRCLAQVGMVFGGLFVYWGINWLVTGDPMTYLIYQKENWYQQPGSFWASTANTVSYLISTCGDDDWLFTWGFQLLAMGYIYILLAARQKKAAVRSGGVQLCVRGRRAVPDVAAFRRAVSLRAGNAADPAGAEPEKPRGARRRAVGLRGAAGCVYMGVYDRGGGVVKGNSFSQLR